MNEQRNVETIIDIYEAFRRGDIEEILANLTEDIHWDVLMDPIVPWSGDYSRKTNVPDFFNRIFTNVEVLGFEPKEFVAQGDTVVSMGTFSSRANSTGKSACTAWIFIWKFRGDKVCSYEQFHDPSLADIFRVPVASMVFG